MKPVLDFLFRSTIGPIVAAGLGLAALVTGFAYQQQSVGAAKQVVRQGKADANAVKNATDAARRSADPAARGLRDPNARAE